MDLAKKLLNIGKAHEALNHLKDILPEVAGTQDEWKVHEMIGAAFHDLGNSEGAAQAYFNAAKCDKYLRSQRTHYSNYLFNLHYLNGIDNETLAQEHFIYNKLYSSQERISCNKSTSKISIGYIAPHFVESSAARFYEALLTEYNRNEFIIKCFSLSDDEESFTEFIKSNVDKYIELNNLSIEETAQKIADEGVDILFDLGGHTDGGMTLQIMSYKPAPIQVSGIGYFDTTGLETIDYILTDNYLAPIGHEKFFTEKLLRKSSAFAFKPSTHMLNSSTFHTPDSRLTFGSFNNFMKITDDYLRCVKKILNKVENSTFIMQDTTAISTRKTEMERRLHQLNMPIDKIEIRLGNDDYLSDYADIDIMLDTFPYNGGTMTATALYMGVPVISIYGTRHSSRFGADILRLAGLTNLIANDTKNYVDLAISLASNPDDLIELKQNLRSRLSKSKLFDTKTFVAELEHHYKRMVGAR